MTLIDSSKKPEVYTKAVAITPHDTNAIATTPDALYIGSGNFTDADVDADLFTPDVWLRGGRNMTGTAGSSLTGWDAAQSTGGVDVASFGTINRIAGTTETNMVDVAHIVGGTSGMTISDSTAFDIGTGEFEFMTLIKIEDKGTGVYQRIVSRDYDAPASNWSLLRRATSSGGNLKMNIDGSDPVGSSVVPLDTWVVVGVARDSSGDIQIYIDGVADGSAVNNTTDLDTHNDPLILGARWTGTAYSQGMQGYMAEFLLWEGELRDDHRAAVVKNLQDRYLNTHTAQIKSRTDSSDAGTETSINLTVGEVHSISSELIKDTGTYAGNIVGLYKD